MDILNSHERPRLKKNLAHMQTLNLETICTFKSLKPSLAKHEKSQKMYKKIIGIQLWLILKVLVNKKDLIG